MKTEYTLSVTGTVISFIPTPTIQKEAQQPSSYFFKTFVVGMVAVGCIVQPELTPLIISAGVINAAA